MFIEKVPKLIEYAAFFGSIQIVKYLELNREKLNPSLWLYAVHSNNPELISFLEDKKIEIDDRTFSEAIKCHHNSIARYISDNFDVELNDESILSIYQSDNYEFFQSEIDENMIFFGLCENNYTELINLHLRIKKEEIEKYINQQKEFQNEKIIQNALVENKIDVAYYLLLKMTEISNDTFQNNDDITKIAIPPTIKLIDSDVFTNFMVLSNIVIPSSITSIGIRTFYFCMSLRKITIPSSLTAIPKSAFVDCDSLEQVIFAIPSSVNSIGDFAFANCRSLKQISLPSSVTFLGISVFSGCNSLKHLIIPSSVDRSNQCFIYRIKITPF